MACHSFLLSTLSRKQRALSVTSFDAICWNVIAALSDALVPVRAAIDAARRAT